jgi:hypothetical protein
VGKKGNLHTEVLVGDSQTVMVEHTFHWLTWQCVEPNVDDEVVLWKDDGSTYVHEVVTVKERQGKEDGRGTLVVETGGWRSDSRTVPTTAVAAILNQPASAAEHLRVEKVYGEYRGWQAIEDASRPIMTMSPAPAAAAAATEEGDAEASSIGPVTLSPAGASYGFEVKVVHLECPKSSWWQRCDSERSLGAVCTAAANAEREKRLADEAKRAAEEAKRAAKEAERAAEEAELAGYYYSSYAESSAEAEEPSQKQHCPALFLAVRPDHGMCTECKAVAKAACIDEPALCILVVSAADSKDLITALRLPRVVPMLTKITRPQGILQLSTAWMNAQAARAIARESSWLNNVSLTGPPGYMVWDAAGLVRRRAAFASVFRGKARDAVIGQIKALQSLVLTDATRKTKRQELRYRCALLLPDLPGDIAKVICAMAFKSDHAEEVVHFNAKTNRTWYSDDVFPCCGQQARRWDKKKWDPAQSLVLNTETGQLRACKTEKLPASLSYKGNYKSSGWDVVLPTPHCHFVPYDTEHIRGLDGPTVQYSTAPCTRYFFPHQRYHSGHLNFFHPFSNQGNGTEWSCCGSCATQELCPNWNPLHKLVKFKSRRETEYRGKVIEVNKGTATVEVRIPGPSKVKKKVNVSLTTLAPWC